MSRPQIIVNVTPALARRGISTATGRAFMAFAGATGPTDPVICRSEADALTALVPAGTAAWVGDALNQGAPDVVIVRATAVDPATVTGPEWAAALAKFGSSYGPGQLLIPGVSTAAAHGALLDAAAAQGRTPLLDNPQVPVAATVVTAATGLSAADGSDFSGALVPWVTFPVPGGTTRVVPPSVLAAGLAARGDAAVGHANHAPANTQGRDAGVIRGGVGVTKEFTDAELDALHAAGVSVIRMVDGRPILSSWASLSDDSRFRQLNSGRMVMQLRVGVRDLMADFMSRPIDGQNKLYSELTNVLRGYLTDLWSADALWGETADDAFDVEVVDVNTPQLAAAGHLVAAVQVALTQHTEKITINVTMTLAEGA